MSHLISALSILRGYPTYQTYHHLVGEMGSEALFGYPLGFLGLSLLCSLLKDAGHSKAPMLSHRADLVSYA